MKKLGFSEKDLYAIRRAMSNMPTEGLEYSVAAESIIRLLDMPFLRMEVSRNISEVSRLWDNLNGIDPNKPLQGQEKSELEEKLIWLHEITRIEKPRYLIEDYPFYEKGFNMLIGKAGARKSLIAVDFISKAARQYPEQNFMYLAGEGIPGLKARLKAWEKHQRLQLRNLGILQGSVQFKDDVQRTQFEVLCKMHKISFIVVDTLQTVTVGLDENSTKEMGVFCDIVRDMSIRLDIGIVFVHHLNKQDRYRGSSVLMASADSVLLSSVDDNGLVTLYNSLSKGGKNKDNEEAEPTHKRVLSLEMQIGDDMDSVGVIEDAQNIIDEPGKVTGNAARLLEYLDAFDEGMQVKEIVAATGIGQSSIYYSLKNLMKHGYIQNKHDKYLITRTGQEAYQQ